MKRKRKDEFLVRVLAPHFVAGVSQDRAAPIIKYMKNWSLSEILFYCRKKNWKVEFLEGEMKE